MVITDRLVKNGWAGCTEPAGHDRLGGAARSGCYMSGQGGQGESDPWLPNDGGLSFTQQTAYPFSHPTRLIQNHFNASELWVTSFGNGLYSGVAG